MDRNWPSINMVFLVGASSRSYLPPNFMRIVSTNVNTVDYPYSYPGNKVYVPSLRTCVIVVQNGHKFNEILYVLYKRYLLNEVIIFTPNDLVLL